MRAMSRWARLGLLTMVFCLVPTGVQGEWWPRAAPGVGPLHPALPTSAPVSRTFTEYWPLLQPGWGIPTLQNGQFRGAYWILDMSQPLLPPIATDRAMPLPPPQRNP